MRGAGHPLHPARAARSPSARKAILLLNRRGWSNFLTCRTCGKVWECPQCDVALVLHRAEHVLACHHCGHRERVPERCDACGSPSVARYGAGTERLEAELAEALDVPVFRLDADTPRPRTPCPSCWPRFAAAPAGLLLGTQMVAKGHDFPDVTLGVVRRRRLDAALPRLPRRGADVRAGRAARGPGRPRARAAGGCSCRRPRPTRPRSSPPRGTTRGASCAGELERRARARLPAVRGPDPGGLHGASEPSRPRAAAGAVAEPAATRAAPRCSARRRCSGCAAASAARSSSRPATAPPRSPPCAPRWSRARRPKALPRRAFSVDVDPQ